jgi:hypothetical protein
MVAMRLLARLIALLAVVLGMSVALAWAWDSSDKSASAAHAAGTLPNR